MAITVGQHQNESWTIDEVAGHVHIMTVVVEGAWHPLLEARSVVSQAAAAVLDQIVADAAIGRVYQALGRYFIDSPQYRDGELLPWRVVPLAGADSGTPGASAPVVLGALAPDVFLQVLDATLEQEHTNPEMFSANTRTVFPCRDVVSLLPASGKLTRSLPTRTLGRIRRDPARYALVMVLLREDDSDPFEDELEQQDERTKFMLRAFLGQMAPGAPVPVSLLFRLLRLEIEDPDDNDTIYLALESLDLEPSYSWDEGDDTITVLGDDQSMLSTALRLVGSENDEVVQELAQRVDQALVDELSNAQESGEFDIAVALVPHLRWRAEQAIAQAHPSSLELLRVLVFPLSAEDPWALTRLIEQFYATLDNALALQDEATASQYVVPLVQLAEALGQITMEPGEELEEDARAALLTVAHTSLQRAAEVLERQSGLAPHQQTLMSVHILQAQASLPDHAADARLALLRAAEQRLAIPPSVQIEQQDAEAWSMTRYAIQAKIAAALVEREEPAALDVYDQLVADMVNVPAGWVGLRWHVLYERGLLRLRNADAAGGIADLQQAMVGMESYPDPEHEGEDRLPAPLRFMLVRIARDLSRALLDRQEPGDATEALRVLRLARQRALVHARLLSDVLGEIAELEQIARAATRPAHQRRRPRGSR